MKIDGTRERCSPAREKVKIKIKESKNSDPYRFFIEIVYLR